MQTKHLEIHTENILPIIKKWLYSDHDIFVRELVSNSCDAISKLEVLRGLGEAEAGDAGRIDIRIDKVAGTLTFSDTGLGMTEEEVINYIARVAFSGAEDFLKKYKSNKEDEQMIGHFGLGFYSSYMVADTVEIQTKSYKKSEKPVHWICQGSSEYTLDEGKREKAGTDIILHVNEENKEFLEEGRLREILQKYCLFIPFPIFLNGKQINKDEPLWMRSSNACEEKDYIDFYRTLYPGQDDPLFWIHLNVDYPFTLKGILYFPKLKQGIDLKKYGVKLFCNRVFVSDNCKDILPEYLTMLQGALDSADIPLNVSRSTLQMNSTVRKLGAHIAKKVADSLIQLYEKNKEKYLDCWYEISPVIKLGALEDDKFFERVKPILVWQNTLDEWKTLDEAIASAKDNIIYYVKDKKQSASLLEAFKGVEVLTFTSPIDEPYLVHRLEEKCQPLKFRRIDSSLPEHLLDPAKDKVIVDSSGRSESAKIADSIKKLLNLPDVHVEAKSLSTEELPALVYIDENERRMRDYMRTLHPEEKGHTELAKKTFVVNTNHPLIQTIGKIEEESAELAEDLAKEIYEISLLSQKELPPEAIGDFLKRTNKLLAQLIVRSSK